MKTRTTLATLALVGLSACATQGDPGLPAYTQAGLPQTVQVPAGHAVAMYTTASGDITYQCQVKKNMAGQFEWVFVGPDAGLNDRSGKRVGKYYGPPATWESLDGSKVGGAQVAVAAAGTGRIPLQLVKANAAMGMGAMQGVSYIQRVNTQGGVAPASPCDAATLDQKQRVRYSADYVFWRGA